MVVVKRTLSFAMIGRSWHWRDVACTADLGSRLFWLNLRGTRVTDAELKHLEGLSELIGLAMEGSRVSPGGMAEFRKVLPDVLFIEVGSSPATFDVDRYP
jgi:hypothetical protein